MRTKILMAVLLIVVMLVAVPSVFASSTEYRALTAPEVAAPQAEAVKLGSLYVRVAPLDTGTHSAVVALPEGFTVVKPVDMHALESEGVMMAFSYTEKANEFKMTVSVSAVETAATFVIPIAVAIPSIETGDVKLSISSLSGQLNDGDAVVGKIVEARVDLTAGAKPVMNESGTTGGAVVVRIAENTSGAMEPGTGSLELVLPQGFSWKSSGLSTEYLEDGGFMVTLKVDAVNNRILALDLAPTGDRAKGVVRINADISVDDPEVAYGDVAVAVKGNSAASLTSLVVAHYQKYGAGVNVLSATDVLAGRLGATIGTIVIEETAPQSLIAGRNITLLLPEGAKWASFGTATGESGLGVAGAPVLTNDGRMLRYTVSQVADNRVGKITLRDMKVDSAVDLSGDLTVGVEGTAGVSDTVTVAQMLAPVKAEAQRPAVRIGVQDQKVSDITLTESKAGALLRGKNLVLTFPDGITLARPEVKVIQGDLQIDTAKIQFAGNVLTIPIKTESTSPSKLEISGMKYTIDQLVRTGPLVVKVSGSAVNQVNDAAALSGLTRGYAFGGDGIFVNAVNVAEVINAIATTAASDAGVKFVIGDTSYTVYGLPQTMDVAPYLKDGRTFLPLRYIGLSLGVDAENIVWDGQTATLTKGDTEVKVTLGSKSILVNSVGTEMDVMPELVPPGRIMLPYRFVAEAFGASVGWDGATRTVTMSL